jgi:hypothetical protein
VDEKGSVPMKRRDLLRAVASAGVATVAIAAAPSPADTAHEDPRGKRKSQYRENSAEVQTFYRVNRYPVK